MLRKKISLFVFLMLVGLGCEEKAITFDLHKRTPQESALYAMKSSDADLRYKTLVELAKSKAFHDEWAVKAIIICAQTDPSPSVRALAVHNLGRIGGKQVLPTLAGSLDDQDDRVRLEAAWALTQMNVPDCGAEPQEIQLAQKTLLLLLPSDPCLDVRINAARALGQFKERTVLMALVTALKDTDFAVRHEAEWSLVKLTGMTFQGNAAQWVEWVKSTKEPFKNAGQVPAELAGPKRNFFQQAGDDIHRFYVDWQGPSKR